ncbi:uncharacterized protein [Physcomitrium patens]|uniref:uncharacterized protein isoform X2 n=1 Tax=Physcomitrium patens TaxID=3218 RepID=UPI003CCCA76E
MMMRGRGVRMARVSAAIFLWTLAISCVSLVHGATDPSDVSSLNTMFTGLNNDPKLTNWVQSAGDPCSNNWLGITCEFTFVTSIKLSNMGLNGKVEGWVLQKLQLLSVLDLSHNKLNSEIIGMHPRNMTALDLSYNQLTGSFPYLLINVPTLISIKLNNNKLTGTLNGLIFSKLVNLVTLDNFNSAITGGIPKEMGDLASLQFLNMQNNKLTGSIPASLAGLQFLDTLDVSNNMLTGYLPPDLNPKNFRYGGNQLNNQAPPPPPYTAPPPPPKPVSTFPAHPSQAESSFLTVPTIVGIVVEAILVLAAIGISVWFFAIRKRSERTKPLDIESNQSSRRTWFLPLIPPGTEKTPKKKVFEPDTLQMGMEDPMIKVSPPLKHSKFLQHSILKKLSSRLKLEGR